MATKCPLMAAGKCPIMGDKCPIMGGKCALGGKCPITGMKCPLIEDTKYPLIMADTKCPVLTKYYQADLTPRTHCHRDEHENLLMKVKHQQDLIDNMTEQLSEEKQRAIEYDSVKYTSLQDQVDLKSRTIKTLESELSSWHSRVSNMYQSYSSMRSSSIKKDYSLQQIRSDLNTCKDTLSDAVTSKLSLESKIREIEMKRKQAEFEYNQLYDQLHKKHVSWESKPGYTCTDAVTITGGYPCVNTCKPRRNSMCALEKLEKRGSSYERILVPYHLHALDLVDVRDVYKDSWKCDVCYAEQYPTSYSPNARYPYHCYLCNYDICQGCVDRMDGAVVTDHFTYFTH